MASTFPKPSIGVPSRGSDDCFAALDLGSNNCRLLIARPSPSSGGIGTGGPATFTVVDAFSRVIRLGEGLVREGAAGALAPAAMDRALAALGICASKLRRWPVRSLRAVATDACRRAANGAAFLARVRRETGVAFEIISAAEEASLALAGCAPLLFRELPYALVFDVGGGSSELMWVEANGGRPRLIDFVSLPVGVVMLADAFTRGALTFEDMVKLSSEKLAAFEKRNAIAERVAKSEVGLVGTSGTVTTVGALHLGLAAYDRSRVDGLEMTLGEVRAITERVIAMGPAALAEDPRIGKTRASFVLPGIAILEAVLRAWPVGRIRVADRGVREGILAQLMAEARAGRASAAS
jgi:exopolyphosphatase/guanosine-5'-triphosphate,3'-diphosphate pyrophosphatase